MREKRCLAWILAAVLVAGCGTRAEPLAPAERLAEVKERPAEVGAADADADGSRSAAEADSTGRWGGSLGSGS